MKFSLLKISAFAATFACSVSAKEREMPQLRGAVPLTAGSGVAANAVKMSSSSSDSSDKDLSDSSSSFFPEEMDEEDEDKENAAQKRQTQRDERRSKNNPNRSQDEEQRERERKHNQSSNRSNRCTDPNEPGCGSDDYPRSREDNRQYRCDRDGRSCGYRRSDPKDEPNRRRANQDMNCMDDCSDSYSNDEAYENCVRRRCGLQLIKFTEEDFKTLFADEEEDISRNLLPNDPEDEEMDEEDEDKDNAAQKRQKQRDSRRSNTNSNRSQDEEQAERERKSKQASNRSNRCTDPSEPGCGNDNYPNSREQDRQYRCDSRGDHCGYGRVDPRDEPNKRRANEDMNCMDNCSDNYSNDEAYENCVRRRCGLQLIDFNKLAMFKEEDIVAEE